jgi:hypothetical protein
VRKVELPDWLAELLRVSPDPATDDGDDLDA